MKLIFCTIIIGLVLTCTSVALDNDVWQYCYRNEDGGIVFVTDRFDLILPGRVWPHEPNTFVAGNGILVTKGEPGFKHSGRPAPTLKADNHLELTFPGLLVTVVNGEVVEVAKQQIKLGANRIEVIVTKDDTVSWKQLPAKEAKWDALEHAKLLSKRWKVSKG